MRPAPPVCEYLSFDAVDNGDDTGTWEAMASARTGDPQLGRILAEMYAVVAMVRAAQKLPGAPSRSVLATAVAKLARLAPEATDAPMHIDLPDEPHLEELRRAESESAELRIEYFNPARSEVAQRTIRVVRIFSEHGHWYVMADDDKSGAIRNFRVDRIESLVQGGTAPASGANPGGGAPLPVSNAGEVLKPYVSRQTEVGVKFGHARLAAGVALFQTDRETAFLQPDPATQGALRFGPFGEQRNRGIEFSA